MKRKLLYPAFAFTALATALHAPAVLADTTDRYDMAVPPHNVIDLINGNDARDHRDSTKLRNDVRLDDPIPEAGDAHAADDQSWVERRQVENIQSGPETASDALPAAATDGAGDPVRSGASSDDTMNSPRDASATAEADRDHSNDRGAQGDAVMPGDGGGEVGVPGPRDSTAETDSFEGARDTAAGVESTRGAGGGGTTGGAGAGGAGTGPGGAGAGAGGGGAGR